MVEEWKTRVVEERDALSEKIVKLRTFLLSGPPLEALELAALQDQYQTMQRYEEILNDRISRF